MHDYESWRKFKKMKSKDITIFFKYVNYSRLKKWRKG